MAEEKAIEKKLFNLQRFEILQTKINPQTTDYIPDEYAFAWNVRLFPIFDNEGLAELYKDSFEIKQDTVEKVLKYLDIEWQEEKNHTFKEIYEHFNYVEKGKYDCKIDKDKLINILRYGYLHEGFDNSFWEKLLSNDEYPSEAKSITSKFDVSNLNLYW